MRLWTIAAVEVMRKQAPEDKARLKQRNDKRSFVVQIHHVFTPDIESRLSRAVDLLLEAAATSVALQERDLRNTNGQSRQVPDGDDTTHADKF